MMPGGMVYVPKALRDRVLKTAHEGNAHAPRAETERQIKTAGLAWPGLRGSVDAHVASCDTCQRADAGTDPAAHGKMGFRGERRPLQAVVVDHAGPYLLPDGSQLNLLVMMDYATRFPAIAVVPDTSAKETWKALRTNWLLEYGVMDELHSDRGPAFTAQHFARECAAHGIKQVFGNRPADQTRVERANRTAGEAMRKANIRSLREASTVVKEVVWYMRTRLNRSLGMSPFRALYGGSMVWHQWARCRHSWA